MSFHPLYPEESTETREENRKMDILMKAVGFLLALCKNADFSNGVQGFDGDVSIDEGRLSANQAINDIIYMLKKEGFAVEGDYTPDEEDAEDEDLPFPYFADTYIDEV